MRKKIPSSDQTDSRVQHTDSLDRSFTKAFLPLPPRKSTFRIWGRTCLRILCVVLVFDSVDLLKEVADPIYLKSKQQSSRVG